jgi:hypothetical protein
MAFPIAPDRRRAESDSDFYVADPFGLRKAITPVYVRDLNNGMFRGCGTSFYINPFGRQLSAMHVTTDFFNAHGISVRPGTTTTNMAVPNELIGILHDPGLVYGTAPAGDALYVTDFILFPVDQTKHPLAITFSSDRLRFVEPQLDLASWNIGGLSDRTSVYLPIRVGSGSSLEVGDRVLALGFPTNTSWRRPHAQIPTFHEEMRGSVGHVIELHTEHDPERKIWPRIVVDVRWAWNEWRPGI